MSAGNVYADDRILGLIYFAAQNKPSTRGSVPEDITVAITVGGLLESSSLIIDFYSQPEYIPHNSILSSVFVILKNYSNTGLGLGLSYHYGWSSGGFDEINYEINSHNCSLYSGLYIYPLSFLGVQINAGTTLAQSTGNIKDETGTENNTVNKILGYAEILLKITYQPTTRNIYGVFDFGLRVSSTEWNRLGSYRYSIGNRPAISFGLGVIF